jgi:hypothetical protein
MVIQQQLSRPNPPLAPLGRSMRGSHHKGESAQRSIDKMAQE